MRARFDMFALAIGCWGTIAWFSTGAIAQERAQETARPAAIETAKAPGGEFAAGFSATGTIEPQEVMDVGAQVDGRIVSFGNDSTGNGKTIDYNSRVEKGDVLAKIDDAIYVSRLNEARARLQVAQAKQALAEAKLLQAATDYRRAQTMVKSASISQAELDTAKSAEQAAKAGMDVAAAEVAVQKAVLTQAEIELDHTTIRSPIKGTIIDRRVNVGQAVSSRTDRTDVPSLFLIAADLKKLEIWASVNEADIARVHEGQAATFKVDAVPGKVFEGRVRQVRLNAQMTQNVVTYTVVVTVNNSDEKLLPYMTANVRFAADKPASP
jgi:HlyD family secretion protein